MKTNLKIAAAQINPTVGDLDGNYRLIIDAYKAAAADGAQLVVFPEMAMTGYPLQDLVRRESFIAAARDKCHDLIREIKELGTSAAIIFGGPRTDVTKPSAVYNTAYCYDPVANHGVKVDKRELPNFGVFDEKRDFEPGHGRQPIFKVNGVKLGVLICEDGWHDRVCDDLFYYGAEMFISINGSPFEQKKDLLRLDVMRRQSNRHRMPFLYVNLVGGQDELVFDGGSFGFDGKSTFQAPWFESGITMMDFDLKAAAAFRGGENENWVFPYQGTMVEPLTAVYQTLVLGLRDYMGKSGFKSVVLGYSGGVDSGLVAAIACDAIGPENVHLVRLPSKFSSDHSLNDAAAGTDRLGAKMRTIRIEPVVETLRVAYSTSTDHGFYPEFNTYDGSTELVTARELTGIADENIQARARGTILMSISNQEGHLLLSTGNRTETAVGYSTLYGDMSGGFNPIKDCYKTMVWDLCRLRNAFQESELTDLGFLGRATEVVPEAIISKPPSAELRPDQKDSDSLPEYPVLDAILVRILEQEKSDAEIIADGFDKSVVTRVRGLVFGAEYKRRQACPGVKITGKAFGTDRRYPIVNAWR